MNFPRNGKTLGVFSTQWKRFVHAVEIGAVAPTQNELLTLREPPESESDKQKQRPAGGSR